MPKYTIKLAGGMPDIFEYDEFFVEADSDPPGIWIVRTRTHHRGESTDCWDYYPRMRRVGEAFIKTNAREPSYVRREEVLNRDLTCTALEMTCELLSIEKIEEESRQPSLIRLAIQIEKSRAMLMSREPREFLDVYED